MKISIVTAVYNRRNTICHALDSVACQSYPCLEHVIQDGGSTDGTLEAIEKRDYAGARVESCPDDGIYDAINRGILRSTGDVVGLMHADDFFSEPDTLSKISSVLRNSDVDGVYGDLEYVSSRDTSRVIRHWRAGGFSRNKLFRGWMPPHPTLYLRRDVFEKNGLYDTSFRISADYDAILRFLFSGGVRLAYIPEVLVKMRLGGESNKSIRKILLKTKEDYRAIRRHQVGGLGTLVLKNASKIKQFY